VRKVIVRAVLPAGAPDELELLRERAQVLARRGRKEMRDPVDGVERPGRRVVRREVEQGQDPVHVDEQDRFVRALQRIRHESVREALGFRFRANVRGRG
jgi:hypothetical protein